MSDRFVTRGSVGRPWSEGSGDADIASRVPPGQYLTRDFPVLSAGPTPRIELGLVIHDRRPGRRAGDVELG